MRIGDNAERYPSNTAITCSEDKADFGATPQHGCHASTDLRKGSLRSLIVGVQSGRRNGLQTCLRELKLTDSGGPLCPTYQIGSAQFTIGTELTVA